MVINRSGLFSWRVISLLQAQVSLCVASNSVLCVSPARVPSACRRHSHPLCVASALCVLPAWAPSACCRRECPFCITRMSALCVLQVWMPFACHWQKCSLHLTNTDACCASWVPFIHHKYLLTCHRCLLSVTSTGTFYVSLALFMIMISLKIFWIRVDLGLNSKNNLHISFSMLFFNARTDS